jgi:class 3 adenylate cyclase
LLTSYLEKSLIPFSLKIKNFESLWNEEELNFLKKYIFEKIKDKSFFFESDGKPKIFVIETYESKNFEDFLTHLINLSDKIRDEEKFVYFLFLIKLKNLKFPEADIRKYNEKILSIFQDKSLKEFVSLILKAENLPERIPEKFLDLLKILHTFYVDFYFEDMVINDKENVSKYLTGFTIPEKYMSKFEKIIENIKNSQKEDMIFKNIEIQERKLVDDLRESLNIELEDFSKELRDIVLKKKLNLFLPYIKEKSAKWLRSFGIILSDYNAIQKVKKEYEEKFKEITFKEPSYSLPSFYILIKEWEEVKKNILKEDVKFKRNFENIFFEYYLYKKKEKKNYELLEDFIKKGFIKLEMDFVKFEEELSYFFEELLIPNLILSLLTKLIKIVPYEVNDENLKDISYWIAFQKLPKGEYYILKEMENLKFLLPFEIPQNLYQKFKEIICVLVYDIRGSTFMSLKLKDPAKEFYIKNEFNKDMLSIIKKYDGFPLKDLGDGGIILFCENSNEIFENIFEEATLPKGRNLRIPKLFEKEIEILPSEEVPVKAILCARDMYKKSLEFIRNNYSKYRDWFPDVLENYPPLKALFRIGIGIAGGKPGKDIFINYNSFGDIDAAGPAINIANLLAKGKDPLNSLIYIDSVTFFSFLLNSSDWDIECEDKGIFERIKFYLDTLEEFWVFDFPLKGIKIRAIGTDLLDEPDKERGLILQVPEEIEIKEDGEFYFKNHPLRIVYEVLPYERK